MSKRCPGPDVGSYNPPPASVGCHNPSEQIQLFRNLRSLKPYFPQRALPIPEELFGYIPQIFQGTPAGTGLRADQLHAVSLTSILRESGALRYTTGGELREAVGLPAAAPLMLLGTGKDDLLSAFWDRSYLDDLWQALAALNFQVATSFTFSVWASDPRFDRIFNQARNEKTYDILTSLGIPTIPVLFCESSTDYSHIQTWLRKRRISVVAALTQFARSTRAVTEIAQELSSFKAESDLIERIVFIGSSTQAKIEGILRLDPASPIVNGNAVFTAQRAGRLLGPDLRPLPKEHGKGIDRSELATRNIEQYQGLISRSKNDD